MSQRPASRIHMPIRAALNLIGTYVRGRVTEQIHAVAFIILYLVAFQTLVLGTPPHGAVSIALGIAAVVLGLAFFLEGLLLGLMPLGEVVGLQLPKRGGVVAVLAFSLLLGLGATLAEPAIAALRTAGADVTAWQAPVLYYLLELQTPRLFLAIGIGVGFAVAFGMLRFFFGISIKPFVYVLVPLMLGVSVLFARDPKLAEVVGLAWDSGAVTTGAVTVPLILALGIGVSRATGRRQGAGGGFGVIMLASAFPVLSVLAFGAVVARDLPAPVPEATFFSASTREQALRFFGTEEQIEAHAFQRGGEVARRVYYADERNYVSALELIARDPAARVRLLGSVTLGQWMERRASDSERRIVSEALRAPTNTRTSSDSFVVLNSHSPARIRDLFKTELLAAARAVLPLAALLAFVMVVLLRSRSRYTDQVILGIGIAFFGLALLTTGIRAGLAPLGDEVGRQLPRAFRAVERDQRRVIIEGFDPTVVFESVAADGTRRSHFYLRDGSDVQLVDFDPSRYDALRSRYEHVVQRGPIFGPDLTLLGIGLVLLFAFGMGYGSTLAEPALNALGRTVEDITVGTVRRSGMVRAVSIGVGLGLVAGTARILYDIPVVWMLIPPYALLIPLTVWSSDEFAAIAWDTGGVTTGPVTVPLVLAMGLGVGGELGVVDGFGVLALASAYPIVTSTLYGFAVQARQRRAIRGAQREDVDG